MCMDTWVIQIYLWWLEIYNGTFQFGRCFSQIEFSKSSAGKQTRYFSAFSFDMDIKLCSRASFEST